MRAGPGLDESLTIHHEMVGRSRAIQELVQFIARTARANSTVLVEGESGTGKELVARALHRNSPRRGGPFVAVNCAALSEGLLESELFGHERGAFTGADRQKQGKFETASGGTLFLDEVAELGPGIQAKLLRALQEREIDRIGGRAPVPVDIRLVAATNRDLEVAVAAGEFREDLYYRLNVLFVKTPPLRKRTEDIPQLASHFVEKYAREGGVRPRPISPEAAALLEAYDWPGNVRQLGNAIEQAMVLGSSESIGVEDLPSYLRGPAVSGVGADAPAVDPPQTLEEAVLQTKRTFVENVLELTGGNQKEAAVIIGIHPKSMRRFLDRLDL